MVPSIPLLILRQRVRTAIDGEEGGRGFRVVKNDDSLFSFFQMTEVLVSNVLLPLFVH